GHVRVGLARDRVDVLDQIGTLRPGRDRDAVRRAYIRRVDRREVEHEPRVASDLDVSTPLRPPDALGVSLPHLADQLAAAELARPRPELIEQCAADPCASLVTDDTNLGPRDAGRLVAAAGPDPRAGGRSPLRAKPPQRARRLAARLD